MLVDVSEQIASLSAPERDALAGIKNMSAAQATNATPHGDDDGGPCTGRGAAETAAEIDCRFGCMGADLSMELRICLLEYITQNHGDCLMLVCPNKSWSIWECEVSTNLHVAGWLGHVLGMAAEWLLSERRDLQAWAKRLADLNRHAFFLQGTDPDVPW